MRRRITTAKGLLHAKRRVHVRRAIDAQSVIADLRGVAPSDSRTQIDTPCPQARRCRVGADQFVAFERIEAGDIPVRAIARVLSKPGAQGEAAATVDAVEIRVEPGRLLDERLPHLEEELFGWVGLVRFYFLCLGRLLRYDGRFTRVLS
jgi:hypothetical protein